LLRRISFKEFSRWRQQFRCSSTASSDESPTRVCEPPANHSHSLIQTALPHLTIFPFCLFFGHKLNWVESPKSLTEAYRRNWGINVTLRNSTRSLGPNVAKKKKKKAPSYTFTQHPCFRICLAARCNVSFSIELRMRGSTNLNFCKRMSAARLSSVSALEPEGWRDELQDNASCAYNDSFQIPRA